MPHDLDGCFGCGPADDRQGKGGSEGNCSQLPRIAWAAAGNGFLVRDRNGDGQTAQALDPAPSGELGPGAVEETGMEFDPRLLRMVQAMSGLGATPAASFDRLVWPEARNFDFFASMVA